MPFHRLSTSKIAKAVGCHPNTVRLYEQIGFIAPVPRSAAGYRLYTEEHLDQMRLARLALAGNYPDPQIRRSLLAMVRLAGSGDYRAVLAHAHQHLAIVVQERRLAEAAAEYLAGWARGALADRGLPSMQIAQAARSTARSDCALRPLRHQGGHPWSLGQCVGRGGSAQPG